LGVAIPLAGLADWSPIPFAVAAYTATTPAIVEFR
jgi:hypothetical protein